MENGESGGGKAAAGFRILVDADACPREVRELLIRTALRCGVEAVFVANKPQYLPERECLRFCLVGSGDDKADDFIVDEAGGADIAVTADIPLAARLVEKGIFALDFRGGEWTASTIGERLATRDLMERLRSAGLPTPGPSPYGDGDRGRFANALDRAVAKRLKAVKR